MGWSDMAERLLTKTIQVFKVTGSYIPGDGSDSYPIDGVFGQPYQALDAQGGIVITATKPTFGVKLSDLTSAPSQEDFLIVKGQKYQVIESQEDGEGGASLILHKVE